MSTDVRPLKDECWLTWRSWPSCHTWTNLGLRSGLAHSKVIAEASEAGFRWHGKIMSSPTITVTACDGPMTWIWPAKMIPAMRPLLIQTYFIKSLFICNSWTQQLYVFFFKPNANQHNMLCYQWQLKSPITKNHSKKDAVFNQVCLFCFVFPKLPSQQHVRRSRTGAWWKMKHVRLDVGCLLLRFSTMMFCERMNK